MKISIIIPLYQGKKYIPQLISCIRSNEIKLQNSSYQIAELIIINDDPSENIYLEKYQRELKTEIKLIQNMQNEGVHQSRVNGLDNARGDYIHFLDQDDVIAEDFYLKQLDFAEKYHVDCVFSNGTYRGNLIIFPDKEAKVNLENEEHYFMNLKEIISPGQAIIRKSKIPEIWRKEILHYNYCDDAFLWMLLKNAHCSILLNDESLYFHREDGKNGSFSWKKNAEALNELKDVVRRTKCLIPEYENLFNHTVDSEIKKHTTYAALEEKLSNLENICLEASYPQITFDAPVMYIYGYGYFGRRLEHLLKCLGVQLDGIIDRSAKAVSEGIPLLRPQNLRDEINEEKPKMVCITLVSDYQSIFDLLRKNGFTNIFSLESMIDLIKSKVV